MRSTQVISLRMKFKTTDLVLTGLCMLAWAFVFREPLSDIINQAISRVDHGYILMVPLVAIYLAFLRRSRWRMTQGGGNIYGPLFLIFGIVISIYGADRDHLVLWHAGSIFALIGVVVSLLGIRCLVPFAPAVFALFAVVPVPGVIRHYISQPMQQMATGVTSSILDLLGVPVIQMGNVLHIHDRAVAVGEACDGMRLMLPLGLVMYAFVFAIPLKSGARLSLILASVPVAIFCNTLRLVPTAFAYGYFPSWATIIHDLGGWLMIPMAIWVLLLVLRLAVWLDLPVGRWRLVGA